SLLQVPNKLEGYDVAALITRKRPNSRDIMVCMHGSCANKDWSVPRLIADSIDYNTCRFDFGGNGKSGGEWRYSAFEREFNDTRTVVRYLQEKGWNVTCLQGHSKGVAALIRYGATYNDIPLLVNVAGRFMSGSPCETFSEEQMKELKAKGQFKHVVLEVEHTIYQKDLDELANMCLVDYCQQVKSHMHSIHGDADSVVPYGNVYMFDDYVMGHTIDIIPGGSHNFSS
ncbi:unnamed protein product, partial [Chrysoparadoxa australica]